jgi:hypothetical protein
LSDVPADELRRLARKYETLAALRRARARGEPVPAAPVFKALAREFPGCLNELDTLPLETIDARAAALARAADGEPVEPWMAWLSGYHALLRAALALKPRVARSTPPLDDARADRLAREASALAGVAVSTDFVRGVAAPPGGRLVALVYAELERWHRCPAATVRHALFPRSRR